MSLLVQIGNQTDENQLIAELKNGLGEFNFPQTVSVENKMPFAVVESEICLQLDSNQNRQGVHKAEVTFPTFTALSTFALNMATIAKMNRLTVGVVLSAVENTPPEPVQAVEEEPKNAKGRKTKNTAQTVKNEEEK